MTRPIPDMSDGELETWNWTLSRSKHDLSLPQSYRNKCEEKLREVEAEQDRRKKARNNER